MYRYLNTREIEGVRKKTTMCQGGSFEKNAKNCFSLILWLASQNLHQKFSKNHKWSILIGHGSRAEDFWDNKCFLICWDWNCPKKALSPGVRRFLERFLHKIAIKLLESERKGLTPSIKCYLIPIGVKGFLYLKSFDINTPFLALFKEFHHILFKERWGIPYGIFLW